MHGAGLRRIHWFRIPPPLGQSRARINWDGLIIHAFFIETGRCRFYQRHTLFTYGLECLFREGTASGAVLWVSLRDEYTGKS